MDNQPSRGRVGTPGDNMEFEINIDPEGEPFVAYLGNVWPGAANIFGETAEGAGLNWALRPMPGSPAITRKAGAYTPVYDTGVRTGTWDITRQEDFVGARGFRQAYNDSNSGTLAEELRSIHDIDGDGLVNAYDFSNGITGGFLEACVDCAPWDCNGNGVNDLQEILEGDAIGQDRDVDDDAALDECAPGPIPTVSEWGLITLTLLTLTAGILVYSRRRTNSFC